jgi:AraC-like DNA-binding protein
MESIKLIVLLLCGFSVFSGVLLALTQIHQRESRLHAWALITAIVGVQVSHAWLFTYSSLPSEALYIAALFCIAPSFYLFIKAQLVLEATPYSWRSAVHFTPLLLAWLLPHEVAMPLAFLIGGVYLFWLFRLISKMRDQRELWQREVTLLLFALLLGTGVFVLGLSTPLLDQLLFHLLYASGIGAVFVLLHLALLWNPRLPEEVSEVAQQAYTNSTLVQVDSDSKLQALQQLMDVGKVYQESDLKLASLAKRLGLSGHQLSELINTHHGIHFSRYIRQYRVEAAQQLLLSKPALSVLDVGMEVGFSSQSTFYDAFRDLTGTTPAKYRKINR